jgi:hypothetical protein
MRAPLLLALTAAAALSLTSCGNNDQTDKTQNVDENLTAENIVSNDVTAIDAVTGDASNMAADVEYNDIDNSLDNGLANDANAAAPAKPAAKAALAKRAPAASPASNASTNAAD